MKLYLLGILTIYFIAAVKATNGFMCAYAGDLRYTLGYVTKKILLQSERYVCETFFFIMILYNMLYTKVVA